MADPRALLPLVAVSFAVAAVVGFSVSSTQPTVYQARATLTESAASQRVTTTPNAALASRQRISQFRDLASNPVLLRAVSDRLGLADPDGLPGKVDANTTEGGAMLEISALDEQPGRAAAIANGIADELASSAGRQSGGATLAREIDNELASRVGRFERIDSIVERLRSTSEPTNRQLRRLRRLERGLDEVVNAYSRLAPYSGLALPGQLQVISPAQTPRDPVAPRPFVDALLAGCLGALLALPLGLVPHFLDSVIRIPQDVTEVTGLATLAEVPRVRGDLVRPELTRRATLLAPWSPTADAYRVLRWACETARDGSLPLTILFVGPTKSDGASMAAVNVAAAFAQWGRRVVLVDADLDHPRTHRMLGTRRDQGLSEALVGQPADLSSVVRSLPEAGFGLLAAGDAKAHRDVHVGSGAMLTLLEQLKSSHDVVVIDCPPVDASSAALVLGGTVDASILVADRARTSRSELDSAAATLAQSSVMVLGVALIRRPPGFMSALADALAAVRSVISANRDLGRSSPTTGRKAS